MPNILPHAAGLMAKVFPPECAVPKQRDYLGKLKYMIGEFSRGGKKGRVMKIEAENQSTLKSPLKILLAEGKVVLEAPPANLDDPDDIDAPGGDESDEEEQEQSVAGGGATGTAGSSAVGSSTAKYDKGTTRSQPHAPLLSRDEREAQRKQSDELREASRGTRSIRDFLDKPASFGISGGNTDEEQLRESSSSDDEGEADPKRKRAAQQQRESAAKPAAKLPPAKKRVLQDSSDEETPLSGKLTRAFDSCLLLLITFYCRARSKEEKRCTTADRYRDRC